MKPTLEQLNELSDYELRYEVATKKGYNFACLVDGERLQIPTKEGLVNYDPCNDPRDYMPIAIEHGITIELNPFKKDVRCISTDSDGWQHVTALDSDKQTGRAVCIAFLLMEIDK